MDSKILLIGLLGLILFVSGCSQSDNYTIEGDSVYVNDSLIYMKTTPHTVSGSGWVETEFTSKQYSGDVDFAFGFDTTSTKPKALQLYSPHEESFVCDAQYDYTYTLSPNYLTCYETNTYNGTDYQNVIWEGEFIHGNLAERTVYYNVDWIDWNPTTHKAFEYDGMTDWWYATNQHVTAGTNYKVRYYLEVRDRSGKYALALKPSSETFQQALDNEHLYYLDPWYTFNLATDLDEMFELENNGTDMINGNNVAITGATYNPSCVVNGCYDFDGTSDYLEDISGIENFNVQSMTVSAWFNTSTAGVMSILANEGTGGKWYLNMNAGKIYAYFTTGTPEQTTGTGTYNDGSWHMVTMTKNATAIEIWVDGTVDKKTASTMSGTINGNTFRIAEVSGAIPDHPFIGSIDEVSIWNIQLSSADIIGLYNSGAGLAYPFEEFFTGPTIVNNSWTPNPAYVDSSVLTLGYKVTSEADSVFNISIKLYNNSVHDATYDYSISNYANGTFPTIPFLTAGKYVKGDNWTAELNATDTNGNVIENTSIVISNSAPTITYANSPFAAINWNQYHNDYNISLDFNCSDLDLSDSHTFSLLNLTPDMPTALTIGSTNGTIFKDVNVSDTGVYEYNVSCSDGTSTSTGEIDITVLNHRPTIPTDLSPDDDWTIFTDNIELTCNNSTDADSDPIYYEFWGNLTGSPKGLLQNSTNTTYNWTNLIVGNPYEWNCRAHDTYYYSNYTTNRTINLINFTSCTGNDNVVFNITYENEDNGTALSELLQANFQLESESGDTSEVLFDLSTNTNHKICLDNNNQSVTITTGMLEYSNADVDARNYYFYNAEINQNTTTQLKLYSLPVDLASGISISVVDDSGNLLSERTIYVERYDVATNTYRLVAMGRTGDDGKDVIFLRGGTSSTGDAWYRFKVYYEGELLLTTLPQKIIAATLTLPLGTHDYQTHEETIDDVNAGLTYNELTQTFTTTYSTTSGLPKNICMKVVEQRPGNYMYTKYEQCVNSASGVLSYQHDNTTFTYHAYAYSYGSAKDILDVLSIENIVDSFGTTGVFLSALIIIMLVTVGTFSPIAAVLLGTLGLIGVKTIGLLSVSQATVTAIVALALIIIVKLGRSGR